MTGTSIRRIIPKTTRRRQTSSGMMMDTSLHRILASSTERKTKSQKPVILPESEDCESQYNAWKNMKNAYELIRNNSRNTRSDDNTNISATPNGTGAGIANRNQWKDTAAALQNNDKEKQIDRVTNKDMAAAYHPDTIPNNEKPSPVTSSTIIGDKEIIKKIEDHVHYDSHHTDTIPNHYEPSP